MGFQGLKFKQPRSGSSATPYTHPEARHAKKKIRTHNNTAQIDFCTPVRDCPGVFLCEKWSFCWYFRSQKNTPPRDDSPDMGLLLSHRPTFGISPSASGALFVEKHASLSAPIGDGAVLRRGYLHPIKAESPRNDALGKPDPHSHARSARPDACDVRVMNSNDLPTRCIKPTDAGKRRRAGS